jgi:hypothetical protein
VFCETVHVSLGFVPWKLQQVRGPIWVCRIPAGADSVCLSVCETVYAEFELLHWLTWPPRSARWLCDPELALDAVADCASDWVAEAEFEPVMVGHVVPNGGGLDGEIAVGHARPPFAGPPCWIRKLCPDCWPCATAVALPASRLCDADCETFATFGPEMLHWKTFASCAAAWDVFAPPGPGCVNCCVTVATFFPVWLDCRITHDCDAGVPYELGCSVHVAVFWLFADVWMTMHESPGALDPLQTNAFVPPADANCTTCFARVQFQPRPGHLGPA